jgi:hypothetical protein
VIRPLLEARLLLLVVVALRDAKERLQQQLRR